MNFGIYCLLNVKTGKRYIGSTNSFKRRKKEHYTHLNSESPKTGYSVEMFKDAKNYGSENIKFEIIEEHVVYDRDIMRIREAFFIGEYDTIENGYNTATPDMVGEGNPNHGCPWGVAQKMAMSDTIKAQFENGRVISNETKIRSSEANKKRWANMSVDAKNAIMSKQSLSASKFTYRQLTMSGDFVREYGSVREILTENPTFRRAGIYNAVSGHKGSHRGFKWERYVKI